MKAIRTALVIFALATAGQAQKSQKEFPVHGKVEAVDEAGKKITLNHDKIEGLMDAMTMAYKVEKAEDVKKLKVGDQITATVTGDYILHKVQVVAPKK